jgi:hypothetical protein
LKPDFQRAWFHKANALENMNRLEEAEAAYQKAEPTKE